MDSIDFNKYDDLIEIKDYEGFIDPRGYFYKVAQRKDKIRKIDHNLWAEEYLKMNTHLITHINYTKSGLFTISQISSPSDFLVNVLGFVYYSHDIDYLKPIIKIPNPMYNNCSLTKEQDEILYDIMTINNEHPENNPIFLNEDVYNYVGMNEEGKRR